MPDDQRTVLSTANTVPIPGSSLPAQCNVTIEATLIVVIDIKEDGSHEIGFIPLEENANDETIHQEIENFSFKKTTFSLFFRRTDSLDLEFRKPTKIVFHLFDAEAFFSTLAEKPPFLLLSADPQKEFCDYVEMGDPANLKTIRLSNEVKTTIGYPYALNFESRQSPSNVLYITIDPKIRNIG